VKPYEQFTRDILAGTRGKSVGAMFDFDGTIIASHSIRDMFLERVRGGEIGGQDLFDMGNLASRYLLGSGDFTAAVEETIQGLKGVSHRRLQALGQKVSREHLAAEVFPEMRAIIRAHQRHGHTVAIVSSATRYQVEALARRLGIEHILCTEPEVVDGNLSGRLVGKVCYGEAKVDAVRKFARKRRITLGKSYFYSNGVEDLPLLEKVGHPVTVNADGKLESVARRRDWKRLHLESRGIPGLGDIARSMFIYGSAVPFLAAGLPLHMLGAGRAAMNFSLGAWTSVATAIGRLKLIVEGEQHLWSRRPAVFVFNHQSAIDVLITAKLLREDIVGVAKKEIKYQLPMGPAFTWLGTVYIDREHVGDPQVAMQPALKAIRSRRSVVIAPEGTRSSDGVLKRFKHGAFHLAQQAGVPIVPIVIHNAQDALPYRSLFVRPAEVQVTVLEPVSTDDWEAEDVPAKAKAMRARYLEVLGQADGEQAVA
jgi:putative phosphoserine phosphatase/1-acylglycerol-3-phosphate O-acyltransferase